jgi:hypothetical protein
MDLQICKWISHHATELKEEAKANATTKAAKDTQSIYKQQYNITHYALDKDLHKIRMHHNTLLTKACEDAIDDLTALKAKLKMEKVQTRINLEQQEYFLGKAECHHQAIVLRHFQFRFCILMLVWLVPLRTYHLKQLSQMIT